MEKKHKLFRPLFWISSITISLLLIPFIAMQFTNEVNWSVFDFIIMGSLISGTCFLFYIMARRSSNFIFRLATSIAILSSFLLIWVNLAVGLIGSGPNIANLMYIAVFAILIGGTYFSRLAPQRLQWVMFIAASSLFVFAIIQLLAKMYEYPGSSIVEILGVNSFFATLFLCAGLLFRLISRQPNRPANRTITGR